MSLKLGLRNKIRRSRAGGAVPILLDQSFASGATAAYSLRRLKSSATKAVRVREDSGNTETDIGFSGGTLDTTALLNHVGSNNGFVTKWYDQSGNGNDTSQSNASQQPQIVSGGTVIQKNGQPAVEFDGHDDQLFNSNLNVDKSSKITMFAVTERLGSNSSSFNRIFDLSDLSVSNSIALYHDEDQGDSQRMFLSNSNNSVLSNFTTKTAVDTDLLHTGIFDKSVMRYYENQSELFNVSVNLSFDNNLNFLSLSNRPSSLSGDDYWFGRIKEAILYDSDKSSNRAQIETIINNHYSIF